YASKVIKSALNRKLGRYFDSKVRLAIARAAASTYICECYERNATCFLTWTIPFGISKRMLKKRSMSSIFGIALIFYWVQQLRTILLLYIPKTIIDSGTSIIMERSIKQRFENYDLPILSRN